MLQPKPTLSKKKEEEKKLGKLELAIRWKHNPDRVIQLPEAFHQDDLLDQPANYLQICLVRARKLKIMDKSRLASGGSSDPLVHFSLDGEGVTSTTKKKNLRPVWVEYFELPIEDEQQTLSLTMEDYEQFSSNQVMGRCTVDMSTLKGRETFRKWLELLDEDHKEAGWVEIALRWAHAPQRVLDLPDEFTEPETEENLSKEANELLVCLLRGKNLPVMDKNLLGGGGSSDPCAFLNLDGEKRKSRVIKKSINPQWMQTFRFPCDDGLNVTLQVDVEDYDLKGNDFMGPRAASRSVSGTDGDGNAPRRPVRRLPRRLARSGREKSRAGLVRAGAGGRENGKVREEGRGHKKTAARQSTVEGRQEAASIFDHRRGGSHSEERTEPWAHRVRLAMDPQP